MKKVRLYKSCSWCKDLKTCKYDDEPREVRRKRTGYGIETSCEYYRRIDDAKLIADAKRHISIEQRLQAEYKKRIPDVNIPYKMLSSADKKKADNFRKKLYMKGYQDDEIIDLVNTYAGKQELVLLKQPPVFNEEQLPKLISQQRFTDDPLGYCITTIYQLYLNDKKLYPCPVCGIISNKQYCSPKCRNLHNTRLYRSRHPAKV